ncbi:MarR family transcriptional regulator [Streptomyces sp. CNQ-509]|nr:MarR family transcriptional regulator [Streptomyces sp. CNQ-509]
MARGLKPLGVTPAQAEVVRLLAERQPLTLSGLGSLLVCESGSNPSRLVDRLVTAGLVRREEAPHDRRHVELTLTPAGHQTARGVAQVEAALHARIADAASAHDLQAVRDFLRALVAGESSGEAIERRAGR